MKKSIKNVVAALFIVLVSIGGVGCASTEQPQWLKEQICEHDFDEQEIIKEPTCTEKGVKLGICIECGETKLTRIRALGHDVQTDEGILPTCIESGLTEGSHCVRCNEILTPQIFLPATQVHTVVTLEGVPATCEETGLTEGSQCSYCNEILIPQEIIDKAAHNLSLITESEDAHGIVCSVCHYHDIEPHTANNWVTEGTIGVDIREVKYCDCGYEMETFNLANVNENGEEMVTEIDLQVADLQDTTSTTFSLMEIMNPALFNNPVADIKGLSYNGNLFLDLEGIEATGGGTAIPATVFGNVLGEHIIEFIVYSEDNAEHAFTIKVNVINSGAPLSEAEEVPIANKYLRLYLDGSASCEVTFKAMSGGFSRDVNVRFSYYNDNQGFNAQVYNDGYGMWGNHVDVEYRISEDGQHIDIYIPEGLELSSDATFPVEDTLVPYVAYITAESSVKLAYINSGKIGIVNN